MGKQIEQFLRYGDSITFYSPTHSGYLFSDGFLDSRVSMISIPEFNAPKNDVVGVPWGQGPHVSKEAKAAPNNIETPEALEQLISTKDEAITSQGSESLEDNSGTHFSGCMFQICPKNQYSAEKQLRKYLKSKGIDQTIDNDITYKQLKKKVKTEKAANERESTKMNGKVLTYGSVIQLVHTHSIKTVSVRSGKGVSADVMNVVLEKDGSESSWFVILPRYKVRSEGDKVHNGDQIVLQSVKQKLLFHVLSQPYMVPGCKHSRKPVDVSENSSRFRIGLFQSYLTMHNNFIHVGDTIRLLHNEEEKFLTSERGADNAVFLTSDNGPDDSRALFSIQMQNQGIGGMCSWKKLYRFRHLGTGEYLAIASSGGPSLPGTPTNVDRFKKNINVDAMQHELVLTRELTANSLFKLFPTTQESGEEQQFIHKRSVVWVQHVASKLWVHTFTEGEPEIGEKPVSTPTTLNNNNNNNNAVKPPEPKAGAAPVVQETKLNVGLSRIRHDDDAFTILPASHQELLDLNYILTMLPVFDEFLQKTRNPSLSVLEIEKLIEPIISVLKDLIFFCMDALGIDSRNVDPLRYDDGVIVRSRQKLLREQRVIEQIMKILRWPFDSNLVTLEKIEEFKQIHYLCRVIHRLLYHFFREYTENELYFAKPEWFSTIQQQVGYKMDAEFTLTKLLDNNEELLEKAVDAERVKQFIQLIKEKGKEVIFLNFLEALCLIKDKPLRSKQELLCKQLFLKENREILIVLKFSTPENSTDTLPVDNDPKLAWVEGTKLKSCPIEFFVASGQTQKLAQYFEEQIKLFSALCAGRNYVAIESLKKDYGFTQAILTGWMMNTKLPLSLRTAFIHLFIRLYIDHDPQKEVVPLELTQLWGDIKEIDIENYDFAEQESEGTNTPRPDLTVIKIFILEYLSSHQGSQIMDKVEVNGMISAVLLMFKYMVVFGFYKYGELDRVMESLIKTLDGRTDFASEAAARSKQTNGASDTADKHQDTSQDRYETPSTHLEGLTAKIQMLEILDFVHNVRLNYRLSKILALFKKIREGPNPNQFDEAQLTTEFESLFLLTGKYGNYLDFDNQGGKILIPVLVDLAHYRYNPLASAAMKLLLRQFSERSELLHALEQVQLLVTQDGVLVYKQVSSIQQELVRLEETSELWLESPSSKKQSLEEISDIFEKLTTLCKKGGEIQRLMRNMGTHTIVIKLIDLAVEIKVQEDSRQKALMKTIICGLEFLAQFCVGNKSNKVILFASMDKFLSHLSDKELRDSSQHLIVTMLQDIPEQLGNKLEKFLQYICALIEESPAAILVDILKTLVTLNGAPYEKNQLILLKTIQKAHRSRLMMIVKEESYSKIEEILEHQAYHIAFMELVVLICKNNNACKKLCRGWFSLHNIQYVVTNPRIPWKVKDAHIRMLHSLYLKADIGTLGHSEELWSIIRYLVTYIEKQFANGQTSFEHLFSFLASFLSDHYTEGTQQGTVRTLITICAKMTNPKPESAQKVLQVIRAAAPSSYNQIMEDLHMEDPANLPNSVPPHTDDMPAVDNKKDKQPAKLKEEITTVSNPSEHSDALMVFVDKLRGITGKTMIAETNTLVEVITHPEKLNTLNDSNVSFLLVPFLRNTIRLIREQLDSTDTTFNKKLVDLFTQIFKNKLQEHEGNTIPLYGHAVILHIKEQEAKKKASQLQKHKESGHKEKDHEGQISPFVQLQNSFVDAGATQLIVQLVCQGEESDYFEPALQLGAALLQVFNKPLQDSFLTQFMSDNGDVFFETVRNVIRGVSQKIIQDRKARKQAEKSAERFVQSNGGMPILEVLLRFLQLLCEYQNIPMKNFLRHQRNSARTFDIVSEISYFLLACVGDSPVSVGENIDESNVCVLTSAIETLTELVAGPCIENQEQIVAASYDNSRLPDSIHWILMDPLTPLTAVQELQALQLKMSTVLLMLGLLEGSTRSSEAVNALLLLVNPSKLCNFLKENYIKFAALAKTANSSRNLLGELCQQVYILALTLAQYSVPLRKQLKMLSNKKNPEHRVLRKLIESVGTVEVWREKFGTESLERVYFPIPKACRFLTDRSKDELIASVSTDTPKDKVDDFFDHVDDLYADMRWQKELSKFQGFQWVCSKNKIWASISIFLTTLLNIMLLASVQHKYGKDYLTIHMKQAFYAIGIVQFVFSLLLFVIYITNYAPLIMIRQWLIGNTTRTLVENALYQNQHNNFWSDLGATFKTADKGLQLKLIYSAAYALCTEFVTLYNVGLVVFSGLGAFYSPLFFSALLLDFIVRNETLSNVIRAVTYNGKSLILTALLGAIIIYYFTLIAFIFVDNRVLIETDGGIDHRCSSLIDCFITFLDQGLRSGGGIGDALPILSTYENGSYYGMVIFNLMFFFIVIILLLNIVFGIILDTFAALRDLKEAKDSAITDYCFICSLHRDELEKVEGGFEFHTTHEHPTWEYLYFIIYLKTKNPDDYTGTEQILANLVKSNTTTFFPLRKSMSLDQDSQEDEMTKLSKKIADQEASLQQLMTASSTMQKQNEKLQKLLQKFAVKKDEPV